MGGFDGKKQRGGNLKDLSVDFTFMSISLNM